MSDKTDTPRVEIYDTTLRDGTQAQGVSLSLQDKQALAKALDEFGVDYIEGGYPLSNPKDEAFFRDAAALGLKRATLVAFGMTRRKDAAVEDDAGIKALLDSGAGTITVVGKASIMHVREVLRASDEENLAMIADSVRYLVESGREVFFDAEHFFDGYKADADYALAALRTAADAGASCVVLCDTNGGSTLTDVSRLTERVVEAMGPTRVGIHCHDDCGLGVANSLTAVRHGARQVQGTINGIGERCGNADLVAVIGNLAVKHGYKVLRDGALARLTELSRYVYEVANLNFRDSQPFVGASAFAHKGGMHVSAVQRKAETYEHMDPAVVGNARRILVSELSGVSNIAANAPAKFGIGGDRDAQRKVLKALMQMENEGYQFEAAEGSFDMLIRRTLGGRWYRRLWELDHYRCIILRRGDGVGTEATVKVAVGGEPAHTVAEGDGPVNSLHRALCGALRPHYPCVDVLHLADYKVRVVNTAAESAARVRVVIEWHDPAVGRYFGTVGVSENIIDASWLALVDAMEYKVLTDTESAGADAPPAPPKEGTRPHDD